MSMKNNCWAVRTSREDDDIIAKLLRELHDGRLRQGWGYDDDQDLDVVLPAWNNGQPLSDEQKEARRHWKMGNGAKEEGYMQVDDLVLVPNTPESGRFTICKVKGDYYFNKEPFGDYGHIRPVEVLTPGGVANNHELVHADLRRSLRCRLRMWNIYAHRASLKRILDAIQNGLDEEKLASGSTSVERAEGIVSNIFREMKSSTKERIAKEIFDNFKAEEYETVLGAALEHLFPVSVNHTGGPAERGADLEVVIRNPFVGDGDGEWIVPVQVKDHEGEVDVQVADQLDKAFRSRSETGHVIAVVLLVSNAEASEALKDRMSDLSKQHKVPFVYCGRKDFRNILSDGLYSKGIVLNDLQATEE